LFRWLVGLIHHSGSLKQECAVGVMLLIASSCKGPIFNGVAIDTRMWTRVIFPDVPTRRASTIWSVAFPGGMHLTTSYGSHSRSAYALSFEHTRYNKIALRAQGDLTLATTPRQIQFGLKLIF